MVHSAIRSILCVTVGVLVALPLIAFGQTKDKASGKDESKAKSERVKEYAVIETSLGTFEAELYRNDAPKTVESFVKLAESKFFNGMRFHRVVRGFVIQTGDEKSKDTSKIKSWGTGGRSIWGKEFEDELNPRSPSYKEGYKKGVMAMANRGPNTNTSQFFVMLADNNTLPKNYTIFGRVIKGLEVLDRIGVVEIVPVMGPADGRPKVDVMLHKVTVRREPDTKPHEK